MIFKLITFLVGKLNDEQKAQLRDMLIAMVGAAAKGAVSGAVNANKQ